MTKKAKDPRPTIESIEDLVAAVELTDIEFYELSARSRAGFGDDVGSEADTDPTFELKVLHKEKKYKVRLRVSISTTYGDVVADAGIVYELANDARIPHGIGLDFANRVGIMALLPYVRESIHSLTSKAFGQGLLMPVMRAGDLQFEAEDPEGDTPSE
jgi:hypothetical protein